MTNNRAICPKCISSGEIIERINYGNNVIKTCNFCNGTGEVSFELEEDYLLSLNEDFIDESYDE